jgi:hypothetical protein
MSTILIATDGSEASDPAATLGMEIARATGDEFVSSPFGALRRLVSARRSPTPPSALWKRITSARRTCSRHQTSAPTTWASSQRARWFRAILPRRSAVPPLVTTRAWS